MLTKDEVTLEEVLELVDFGRDANGKLVMANIYSDVCNVFGNVENICGDVGNVFGNARLIRYKVKHGGSKGDTK